MRLLTILLVVLIALCLSGCNTAPWNDKEIEEMRDKDINCVPVVVVYSK